MKAQRQLIIIFDVINVREKHNKQYGGVIKTARLMFIVIVNCVGDGMTTNRGQDLDSTGYVIIPGTVSTVEGKVFEEQVNTINKSGQ
jgi:hypothetical protein